MKRALGILAIVLIGGGMSEATPAPWLEVKSAHFTVITNSGEKDGRRVAWQFEQIRGALLQLWPWAKIDSGRPFVIFAVKDEATLKSLGPQFWEGKRFRPTSFWVAGRDRQWIALRTDIPLPKEIGENPYQEAYWCYASSVFERSFPRRLPLWYRRGIADVMSNTVVRDKELHVGRPIPSSLDLLRERAWVPIGELLSADERSRWRTQELESQLFDAQAWALVHYLVFGEKGKNRKKADQFNNMLFHGSDPETAVREAFGDMAPYFKDLRGYVQGRLFSYVTIPVALDTKAEAYAQRSLPAAESAVLRGAFLVGMSRPAEARAAAAEAAKLDPGHPGPWEIEAELLDAASEAEPAKEAFAKAAAAGSKRAHVYYRLAQLEWTANADEVSLARRAEMLEKARALEPESASVLSFLAEVRTDLGRHEEAVALAKRAVEIEPAKFYHRMALARALWGLQHTEEAVQMAQTALKAADSDRERQRAQAFLDFAAPVAKANAPDAAPSVASTTSSDVGSTPVADAAGVRGPVGTCFEKRDDRACGLAAPVLEAACNGGQPMACRSLGSLYDGGFGVVADKARAATLYDQGCGGGDKASCARYAVLQAQGRGVARDTAQATATLQRLCAETIDDACVGWALLLSAGSAKEELAKAQQLFRESCDRGSDEACRLLKSSRP
jgi:TPR repeat protein